MLRPVLLFSCVSAAVSVGGTVVFQTGPEARPFPKLKAIDIDEIAAMVSAAI